jgi:hypothetical protein
MFPRNFLKQKKNLYHPLTFVFEEGFHCVAQAALKITSLLASAYPILG